MQVWEIIITAFGLAMDAFAVAICKGLATEKVRFKHMLIVGLWFGIFQAAMPLGGYFLAGTFAKYITAAAPWIAFGLLSLIGANMIREAVCDKDDDCTDECKKKKDASLAFVPMLLMAIATSIDAFAVGVGFGVMEDVNIWWAVGSIGVITLVMSALGVFIGNVFGSRFKKKAEIAGGAVLGAMGLKILIEHIISLFA